MKQPTKHDETNAHRKSGAETGKRGPVGEPGYAEAAWAVRTVRDDVPIGRRERVLASQYVYLRDSRGNIALKRTQHIAATYVTQRGMNVHDVRIVPVRVVEVETAQRCGFMEDIPQNPDQSSARAPTVREGKRLTIGD